MRISSGTGANPNAQGVPSSWTAQERVQVYRHVFGAPAGSGEARPNREFDDLWLRFVTSAAQSSGASMHRSARELAARTDPAIHDSFAARDVWQVIDEVAGRELGGALNATRYRSLAEAGGAILEKLAQAGDAEVDHDLAHAAERWLASAVTPEGDAPPRSAPEAAGRVAAWSRSLHAALNLGDGSLRDLRGAVLFSGASGTGKTLAAHWLATELDRPITRLDLAQVVSKYIGETEKNLGALFDRAERSGGMLLFDEADALFGKRTGARDSHDRFANLDVTSLLRRAEGFAGVAIIATNAATDVPADLLKKLRAQVVFPLPPHR